MNNLRLTLLSSIISSNGVSQNKYSNAFNSLKAVIELEKSEKINDKLPKELFDEFDEISIKRDSLNDKFDNIPLLILEQYFFRNNQSLDSEIYIEYNNSNINVIITELYIILEEYFFKIYLLSIKIADFYNLEIKIKKNNSNEQEYL